MHLESYTGDFHLMIIYVYKLSYPEVTFSLGDNFCRMIWFMDGEWI